MPLAPDREGRSPPPIVVVADIHGRDAGYTLRITRNAVDVVLREENARLEEILGAGSQLQTPAGEVFVAYFSGIRTSAETAPDYKQDLWLVIGRELFDLSSPAVSLKLNQGIWYRTLRVQSAGQTIAHVRYKFPIYVHLLRLLRDPFLVDLDAPEVAVELSCLNKTRNSGAETN